jgi:HAE1 family hydrophobic/amphiphilic exporter-1
MRSDPNLVDVDRSFLPGKPELRVVIDRQRAADLGVSVASISETLNFMMAGQEVTTFAAGRDQYDVVLRAQGPFRREAASLRRMTVSTASGTTVPLASVVRLEPGTGAASIDRLNRQRQITLLANVPSGGSQSDALERLQQATATLGMDAGYTASLTGQSRELQKAGTAFALAVALSLIFMYMVLAAQFESFVHPVTIMLTLPLAVPFGLLSTLVAGQSLNIFSILALLLLFGIVKKNAILQVDYTNELRRRGLALRDAVIQANRARLRPILMTTIALVAGMTPLLFGSGPGSATNRSIGVLVAGGQTLCLLLTLLAVPVFYSIFADLGELRLWKRAAARARAWSPRKALAGGTGATLVLALGLPGIATAQTQRTAAAVDLPPRVGITSEAVSLTLDEVVTLALEHNTGIAVARLQREVTALGSRAAQGAFDASIFADSYFEHNVTPQASLFLGGANGQLTQEAWATSSGVRGLSRWGGGSYQVGFTSSRTTTDNIFTTLNPQYPVSLSLRLVQPLGRGLRVDAPRRQIEIASRTERLADTELRARAIDVVTGIEQAYWNLSFAVANLDVQVQALEQARAQVESNRRRANEGLLAPVDVVEAETQVATIELALHSAQELVTRAENTLKTLILPDRSDPMWNRAIHPATPLASTATEMPLEDAVQRALASRPEVSEIGVSEELTRIDERFFRDQRRPQIDVVGSYSVAGLAGTPATGINPLTGQPIGAAVGDRFIGGYGEALTGLLDRTYPTARVDLRIELPLRNRTAAANLAATRVQQSQLRLQRERLAQAIEADVRNTLQALRSAQARVAASATARASAQQQYESEQRRFDAGLSTVFLVLQRQTDFVNAQGREIDAQADLNAATAELRRATGTTLEARSIRLAQTGW